VAAIVEAFGYRRVSFLPNFRIRKREKGKSIVGFWREYIRENQVDDPPYHELAVWRETKGPKKTSRVNGWGREGGREYRNRIPLNGEVWRSEISPQHRNGKRKVLGGQT